MEKPKRARTRRSPVALPHFPADLKRIERQSWIVEKDGRRLSRLNIERLLTRLVTEHSHEALQPGTAASYVRFDSFEVRWGGGGTEQPSDKARCLDLSGIRDSHEIGRKLAAFLNPRRPSDSDIRGILAAIDNHARELEGYIWQIQDAVSATLKGRPEYVSQSSGFNRMLHSEYHTTGLRAQILRLLLICYHLDVPPTAELLGLIMKLDLVGSLPSNRHNHQIWWMAIRVVAEHKVRGKQINKSKVAAAFHLPLSTLRTWMKSDDWQPCLDDDIECLRSRDRFRVRRSSKRSPESLKQPT
jgi:hypothetical protein